MRESCTYYVVLCFGARLTTMMTVVGDVAGQIISDYCPKAMRGPTRAATLALTVATLVGLFQLNTKGEGVTRAVKSLEGVRRETCRVREILFSLRRA